MKRVIRILIAVSGTLLPAVACGETVSDGFSLPPEWRLGAGSAPAWVAPSCLFLKGINPEGEAVDFSFSTDLKASLSYNPGTRDGQLYRGLYQGVGVGISNYNSYELMGRPVSAYVFQGMPFARFGRRLRLGYEWEFGAAFGWHRFTEQVETNQAPVGTAVTARMGAALRLEAMLSAHWNLWMSAKVNHYSNGNTSWPNLGVNTLGVQIGVEYVFNPMTAAEEVGAPENVETGSRGWMFDLVPYGTVRKRVAHLENDTRKELVPGRFAVAGLQFSPLYRVSRCFAAGPGLDLQWDESAGLAPYWVEGTSGSDIEFYRPPFGRQLSVGLSAHAELVMPIFSVNASIGYDVVSPVGNDRFYQSLTLKTFVSKHIFINTGYRLGAFKRQQNLMLGIGARL